MRPKVDDGTFSTFCVDFGGNDEKMKIGMTEGRNEGKARERKGNGKG